MERVRHITLDIEGPPDELSSAAQLPFLSGAEKSLLARVQGRTYANLFALLDRVVDGESIRPGSAAVDRIVQNQAGTDAEYFMRLVGRAFDAIHAEAIHNTMLADYRRRCMRRAA